MSRSMGNCKICDESVNKGHCVECALCKSVFDADCAGVSEHDFQLLVSPGESEGQEGGVQGVDRQGSADRRRGVFWACPCCRLLMDNMQTVKVESVENKNKNTEDRNPEQENPLLTLIKDLKESST